jgi:uncharacterized NAD-dependent epimerase/dehydratase family protein
VSDPILRVDTRGRRFAALVEGARDPLEPKTAAAVARFRPELLAALLDPERAGASSESVVGVRGPFPVVADLEAAQAAGANALLVGLAPVGGGLAPAWRRRVRQALERGLEVWSGLHEQLGEDAELVAAAGGRRERLVDLRRLPGPLPVANRRALESGARVVLTVGSDCNVGKMTAAWEIARELARRGERAAFVATGQTGILLAGWGLAVDRAPADFLAGAAEVLVLEAARRATWVIVEGQGALVHPGYSAVTLGLLHGSLPESLVLCHHAARTHARHAGVPLPSAERLVALYEEAAEWMRPARVLALALNTAGLDGRAAERARRELHRETGLPVQDVVREGAGAVVDALTATPRP